MIVELMLEDEFIGCAAMMKMATRNHVQITVLAEDLNVASLPLVLPAFGLPHRDNIAKPCYCRPFTASRLPVPYQSQAQHHHRHRRIQYAPRILALHDP